MLRAVLFGLFLLGLSTRVRCAITATLVGEIPSTLKHLQDEIDGLKDQIEHMHQCELDVHFHGGEDAPADDDKTMNIYLHAAEKAHDDSVDSEVFHHDDIYGISKFETNGEPGNNVHCVLYIAQHKKADHADVRLVCEGFTDHNHEHDVFMLPRGDLLGGCHSLDHPEHHHSKKIGTVHTDDEGHVDQMFEHTDISLKGEDSAFGKAFAVYDAAHLGLAVACGLAGHSNFSTAYEVIHPHWAEEYPHTELDIYGRAVIHSAHGSHVEGFIHLEQYSEGHYPADLHVDLTGFGSGDHDDYTLVLHKYMDTRNDCENMGTFDPGHHGSSLVAHMTPNSNGEVHKLEDHTDLTMKPGPDSIMGHTFGIHDPHNVVVACGVIGYSKMEDEDPAFHQDPHAKDHA